MLGVDLDEILVKNKIFHKEKIKTVCTHCMLPTPRSRILTLKMFVEVCINAVRFYNVCFNISSNVCKHENMKGYA